MAKRYRAKRRATEDASGLAGWLFTDLLLGLVMIFLSAVAFTAYKAESVTESGAVRQECKETVAAFIKEPLNIQYREGEGEDMKSRIDVFKKKPLVVNGISQNLDSAKVAVGIIYGWYSPDAKANTGVQSARAFYRRFSASDKENFPPLDAAGKVENMRFIGTEGEFAQYSYGAGVELFFVYEQCSKIGPVSAPTLP